MKQSQIYEKIRQIRIEKKLSQQYVAERCGLTQQAINRIEHGKQSISIELFLKLADILNFNISEVLKLPVSEREMPEKEISEKKFPGQNYCDLALELSHNPELFLLLETARKLSPKHLLAYTELIKQIHDKENT